MSQTQAAKEIRLSCASFERSSRGLVGTLPYKFYGKTMISFARESLQHVHVTKIRILCYWTTLKMVLSSFRVWLWGVRSPDPYNLINVSWW